MGVAVMASAQAHLSGGRVNLAILRESYRRELLECLDKCQGSKVSSRLISCMRYCSVEGFGTTKYRKGPQGNRKRPQVTTKDGKNSEWHSFSILHMEGIAGELKKRAGITQNEMKSGKGYSK